jgi:hypothetical protein
MVGNALELDRARVVETGESVGRDKKARLMAKSRVQATVRAMGKTREP